MCNISLRKGRTKTLLEASMDSALLAVEVYNKPRTTFRSEGYIILMIIAWTRLLQAIFNHTIGDRYYYKKKGVYEKIDGEKKAWDLDKCIKEYLRNDIEPELNTSVIKNIDFFIKIRNKIEHRYIDKQEIDIMIFGECQALLYNYENLLISYFGPKYVINESLVYSLQFSQLRKQSQTKSNKEILSKDIVNVSEYINKYRSTLTEEVYNSQEYSIKLLQVPKISNTNRNDLSIEFVNFDQLSEEDQNLYERLSVLIKDRKIVHEGVNIGRMLPGEVIKEVNEKTNGIKINHFNHKCLYIIFKIRPTSNSDDPFDTNTEYCHYDEIHNDYLYNNKWVEFIIDLLNSGRMSLDKLKKEYKSGKTLNIDDYSFT